MKDNILNTFIANPSTNMVDVISNSGYTLESAIADIIDNSLAAKAKNIDVNFVFDGLNSKIIIKDDGLGMSEAKLKEAIIYAYRDIDDFRELTDIGRYSIGLNAASSSFCRCLFLTSKVANDEQHSIKMDFEHIKKSKKWEIFVCENRKENKITTKSGTIVVWERLKIEKDLVQNENLLLNQEGLYSYLRKVELHLSKVFYRYIEFHGVKIRINGNLIEGWDPFFSSHINTQRPRKEEFMINGSLVRIECYVLPVSEHLSPAEKDYEFGFGKNLEELQGFYIYREDRLICGGGWLDIEGLNITPKANYARIGLFVDNTLDKYLSVNFLKNRVTLPFELAVKLKPIARKTRSESSNNYDYKKESRPYKKKHNLVEKPWITTKTTNGVKAQINEKHPIIKSICKSLPSKQRKMLFDLLAKTLPIADFETYHGVDDYYSQDEMIEMLEYKYNELIKANVPKEEIFAMFKKTVPYCEEKYATILYDFMEDKKHD